VGGHAGIFRAAAAGTPPSPRHSAVSRGTPGLTILQQVLAENFVLQSAVVQTHGLQALLDDILVGDVVAAVSDLQALMLKQDAHVMPPDSLFVEAV
jgi:hypothetical protein